MLCFCEFFFGLPPVSCVPNVSSVSGLPILDCPFGFSLTFIYDNWHNQMHLYYTRGVSVSVLLFRCVEFPVRVRVRVSMEKIT